MLVRESISQFVRGGDPKETLGIGPWSGEIIEITMVDQEIREDGLPLTKKEDEEGFDPDEYYYEQLEDSEIRDILENWERKAHPYLGFWIVEDDGDPEWIHPKYLEGNTVKFQGKLYQIPKTNIFDHLDDR